jgi:outer membrane protein assembly factor BamB
MRLKRLNVLCAAVLLGFVLLSACGKPPLVPDKPTGPTVWMKGVANACTTKTTDPSGSQVAYRFDWGDDSESQWSDFMEGGVAFSDTHTYTATGSCKIKAQAKNKKKASAWSDSLDINVSAGEGQWLWFIGRRDPDPESDDSADFTLGSFGISSDRTACIGCRDYGAVVARTSTPTRWDFVTDDLEEFYASPAIGTEGTIYIGCQNETAYAINPNGTKKWSRNVAGAVNAAAVLTSDGAVIFQTDDSMVVAFGSDGVQRWSFFSNGGNASPAIGIDGTVYVPNGEGEIYALDPSSGTAKWAIPYRVSSNAINASLALDPGRSVLYAADEVGLFVAVNLDGTFSWQFSVGEDPSSPVIGADGTVYIGGGGKLWALDPSTQGVKWSITPSLAGMLSTPAVSADGYIYFLVVPGKKDRSKQGIDSLYAVNPDGTPRWACGLGEGSSDYTVSSPKIDDQGLIYVGDGYRGWCVVGLGGPAQSAWPMFQHDAQNTGRAQ